MIIFYIKKSDFFIYTLKNIKIYNVAVFRLKI